MPAKKPAKKPTKKPAAKKLPVLTIEDILRQAITLVASEEPVLADLSDKERSLLVREVLSEHDDALAAVIRGHVLAAFIDLFEDEEDDEDEDEDDEDDEDEDEDDEDEDEDEDDEE
jgi:hypothetical protein